MVQTASSLVVGNFEVGTPVEAPSEVGNFEVDTPVEAPSVVGNFEVDTPVEALSALVAEKDTLGVGLKIPP